MVIGNGMIANSFLRSKTINDVIIFASGVPNSNEVRENEYEREFNLIKKTQTEHTNKKLIYFSSTSLETGKKSKYISFKLMIEKYIKSNFSDFLILRLPNIVGNTENKFQLLPFIKNSLITKNHIRVKQSCFRYLIDVDDLPLITASLIENKIQNKIINVSFDNKIEVIEIVNFFTSKYKIINPTIKFYKDDYIEKEPNNQFFLNFIKNDIHQYNHRSIDILSKYFKN
jgi:nucleoside-diphosphate-sugar epimerase